ncbi:uncharacterized protein B0H18DRAFT_987658 [Fomitopsis serialis]|uniref:uncharacterized protein n=1 Tax=Fomitopsis serialis TaxID=139415 RepID=UPI00200748C5|nr:uncharacterized protein B0H18DRAFT_987658 [Neoantrodia serialis]KAH9932343.1 hypothetical protein B0H18DRAFT_987658 [Neoantrodia serialis]
MGEYRLESLRISRDRLRRPRARPRPRPVLQSTMATVVVRPMLVKARGPSSAGKGRARKALLPSLDTNPSSYDRTDPFAALNVLRTLVASLPARIGGCAYKLTPEEHRLSLHLLTIVEPFVGLAPQRRTLTRQPTEILDAIVFHLDEKRDLLNIALACKRLHGIIFPRHFEYRVVRCKISRIAVWNHLAVHRGLARNVRRLEIMDERGTEPESVPSDILTSDTDLESTDDELGMHDKQERILVSALTRMTALESFVWSCSHSPISIDLVWPTLRKCQALKNVQINDNLVFAPSELPASEGQTSKNKRRQYVLPALKTISLQSTKYTYGASKNPEMTRISGMLTNCPVLESLSIAYQPRRAVGFHLPAADDFLLCARWSTLRTLALTNLRCSPLAGPDAVASFLAAHVQLEVLHLDISFGAARAATICLADETLPRLKELKASREVASAILACPILPTKAHPEGRPLETLKGLRLSGPGGNVFLANLGAFGHIVKRIELVNYADIDEVRKLSDAAPQLTWLDVGKRIDGHGAAGTAMGVDRAGRPAPAIATNFTEWASVLAHFPQLATFHGVRFFYEVAPAALAPPSASFVHNSSSGVHAATIPLAPSERTRLPVTPSDRSRMRKNEEVAATFAWKCQKLRRMDHWEEGTGRVVVLLRDGDKARYEVRRVRS